MNEASVERVPPLAMETGAALAQARWGAPATILGPHQGPGGRYLRVFVPGAEAVLVRQEERDDVGLRPAEPDGLFVGDLADGPYLLAIRWPGGEQVTEDPYAFGPRTQEPG